MTEAELDELRWRHVHDHGMPCYSCEDDVLRLIEEVRRLKAELARYRLSAEDSKLIVDRLLDPPPPNDALRRAFERNSDA